MKNWKRLICAFLILLCAKPGLAHALELRIRNDFNNKLHVAIVYYDATYQRWRTQGWFNADPRKERRVTFNAASPNIYLFAELSGRNLTWGRGDTTKYVISEAFSYYEGQHCPSGSKRMLRKFTKYTANNGVVHFRPRS